MSQHNQTLDTLLAGLNPTLCDGEFLFVTTTEPLTQILPTAMIREGDTFSYVLEAEAARKAGLYGDFRCRRIDLGVDTSLATVGFIARLGAELALKDIPVNPIAGYHRDHLFVPVERANDAVKALQAVAGLARQILARRLDVSTNAHRLLDIGDAIWIVDGPAVAFFGMPYPTRMTVIRLRDGAVFIHSPIALTEALATQILTIGEPRYLIAPNKLHHLSLADWARRFPGAQIYGVAGLASKLAGLVVHPLDSVDPLPWAGEIDQLTFGGSPVLEEVVFFHRASRALIVADLIENFDPGQLPTTQRLLARLAGVLAPHGSMPRDWRMSFFGRGLRTARTCATRIMAWQPEVVLLCHGRIVSAGALPFLRQALRHFL